MARKNKKRKNGGARREPLEIPELDPQTKRELVAIAGALLALLSILAFFGILGPAGAFIDSALSALFGWNKYLVPVALLGGAASIAFPDRWQFRGALSLGIFLFFVSWSGLLNILSFRTTEELLIIENISGAGGYAGLILGYPLLSVMGIWGGAITLTCILAGSLLLTFNVSFRELARRAAEARALMRSSAPAVHGMGAEEESGDAAEAGEAEEVADEEVAEDAGRFEAPPVAHGQSAGVTDADRMSASLAKKRYRKISIPVDLLGTNNAKPTAGDINGRMAVIQKTLENFGIPVEMGEVSVGPTVTQFTLKPHDGVKLSKILSLQNDLALSLAAHPIRIEAPIPGKSLVGIEVPNQTVAIVGLREVLESKPFVARPSNLALCLGKDVAGAPWVANLAKMPHLLVAGATGAGKTVCLNSIILSLLFQNSPEDLRLILIDPKRVELPVYNGIPHLLTPAITETPKILNALKWCIQEMDRRYTLLSKAARRDIESYNDGRKEDRMPYIVVVIDELADLMVSSAAEVETSIIRLAQMARAVGIHLIVATQRPSVDVITGLIKANITSRIAFSVASATDSRTILDTQGAERLVGRGDSLFISSDLSKPKRIQCCYVSDADIRKIVDFLVAQLEEPVMYEEGVTEKPGRNADGSGGGSEEEDEHYDEAKQIVVQAGKASASYLQRRLKVGYARAARLLDLLEENGIIGPGDGAKPRVILVDAVRDADGYHLNDPDENV
jgi:DNA segregation ATPase FtsK/SpoIIIE, S-DNA-T family